MATSSIAGLMIYCEATSSTTQEYLEVIQWCKANTDRPNVQRGPSHPMFHCDSQRIVHVERHNIWELDENSEGELHIG